MRTATEVRREVESALAERIPAALSVPLRHRPALVTTGVPEMDAVLGGGFPLGGLIEIAGTVSSGRTTLVLSTLTGITQQGGGCAYMDVSDAFDPLSAAALGMDLSRLLWVRAGSRGAGVGNSPQASPSRQDPPQPWSRLDQALRATDLLLSTGGFRAIVLDMGDVRPEHARRVPLATWYRFRLQVEKAQALFLLLTQTACANSCAAVMLQCAETEAVWQRASETSMPLLAGFRYRMRVERTRLVPAEPDRVRPNEPIPPLGEGGDRTTGSLGAPWQKKPAASVSAQATWTSTAPWVGVLKTTQRCGGPQDSGGPTQRGVR
jgi:hypothetical protein